MIVVVCNLSFQHSVIIGSRIRGSKSHFVAGWCSASGAGWTDASTRDSERKRNAKNRQPDFHGPARKRVRLFARFRETDAASCTLGFGALRARGGGEERASKQGETARERESEGESEGGSERGSERGRERETSVVLTAPCAAAQEAGTKSSTAQKRVWSPSNKRNPRSCSSAASSRHSRATGTIFSRRTLCILLPYLVVACVPVRLPTRLPARAGWLTRQWPFLRGRGPLQGLEQGDSAGARRPRTDSASQGAVPEDLQLDVDLPERPCAGAPVPSQ